jgi:two-component system, LytTR family, sensor kinase
MKRTWSWAWIAGLALVFWLIVGFADSAWYALSLSIKGQPVPWNKILATNIPYWILAAILTLPVVWVARRASFEPGRRMRCAAIHLVTLLLFAVVHRSVLPALYFPWKKAGFGDFASSIPKFAGAYLDFEVLLYLVIIGSVYVWSYYARYRERARAAAALELERAQLQASLSASQLAALKMQIQPHFLFNVLHAISTLILKGETRAADQMISQLSRFLRMTLDGPHAAVIPLEAELEFLDAYLQIQKVRFGDRLRVRMEIDGAARGAAVPNLILQPLVENCIEHGVEADRGTVEIVVRAAVTDGMLEMEISDNGPGFGGVQPAKEGTGLSNVRARLRCLYPDAHAFHLKGGVTEGGAPVGARVVIRIPFRPSSEEARPGVTEILERSSR